MLAQDVDDRPLGFQPIVAVHHDPPDPTLRLTLDTGETIVTIAYHRFWLAGRGWAMARDAEAGRRPPDPRRPRHDRLDLPGRGDAPLQPRRRPVPDLLRRRADALVHDNTPPDPHQKPFDAAMP